MANLLGTAHACAHPSLALTKYWGKRDSLRNIPATPSLAIGLAEFRCETRVRIYSGTSFHLTINGVPQNPDRFADFFSEIQRISREKGYRKTFSIEADSTANFPVAAGFASSSAGFAALALAANTALKLNMTTPEISALARVGSASAARAVYKGFTLLPAGGEHALSLPVHWPELRIIAVETHAGKKPISSRTAMERCRTSSPFYGEWLQDAANITAQAEAALYARSLPELGPLIRESYARMFAVMLSASPPIRYWTPLTLKVLDFVDSLRQEGGQYWETMDAGPQVKVFCKAKDCPRFLARLGESVPEAKARVCTGTYPNS
ncbi:MAG: diphosphomevalonate decarboxylase [Spirochaeta sp. LUC14_002_19_P3]|nr:MAG: diphosphomevalonate decarboxylase [Spirochaeta sp. LUC14_002_19_P3]